MQDDLLLQVQRPGRYIGEEWNSSRKGFDSAEVKFALCFPDLYEVGMSNLGIRILYGILNMLPGVVCERFFAPATDMEKLLREQRAQIFSLESKKGLAEFDLVGFSLGHELNYTNVLTILDLGAIPLLASARNQAHPLVIGGGPCALNPEPLHEFFDLFVFGEAEEAITEIVDTYRAKKDRYKCGQMSRQDLLVALSRIEGVYVPSLYEVTYDQRGYVERFAPRIPGVPAKITKRIVKDFNTSFFPVNWLVPYVPVVHDRITLEIMRGCPNACNFCQARQQYFPYRIRESRRLLELAQQAYCASGYEELALGGLSVSDYPGIQELLVSLIALFKEKGVGVSLPSIKPKEITGELSALIATIKKTGLTFAPEAATQRLRAILNKHFDEKEFFDTVEQAYRSGYSHIKLYFMIGLPQETEEDLDAIITFATAVSELRRKAGNGPAQINISITALIPKPHTPLQWMKMKGREEISWAQGYLKKKAAAHKRLRLHFHDLRMSFLEGVFSRGDRRLSAVLREAYAQGSRFDAWDEHFIFERWMQAFAACNIDPDFYLQQKPKDALLPWGFLDIGVPTES